MINRNIGLGRVDSYFDEHSSELCEAPVVVATKDGSEWQLCLGCFNRMPFVFVLRADGFIIGRLVHDSETIADVVTAFSDTYY